MNIFVLEFYIKFYIVVRRLFIEYKGFFYYLYLDWRFVFLGIYFFIDKNLVNWVEWVGISCVDELFYFFFILLVDWLFVGMNWLFILLIKVVFIFFFDIVFLDEGLGLLLYKGFVFSGDSLLGNLCVFWFFCI